MDNKMKAEPVKEAYENIGSDVTDTQPQSPGTNSSFPTNMQILEPNNKGVTSPISTVGRVAFLPDEVHEIKMVTLQSRKMRQMSVFLVFFVVISLVMTGLFVWRTVFFDRLETVDKCNKKTCSTAESKKPNLPPCRYRAKPKAFQELPKKIVDQLKFIEESLANNTVTSLANIVYMDKEIWSSFHGKPNRGKKLDEHTLFPVASATKIITALMTFKMYKNRTIDTLDDMLVKYQPNFKIKRRFRSKRKIVIREILSHMSGLPREAPCYPDTAGNICPFDNSEMLRRISDMYLMFKPGLKPSYSNLGFGLLGRILPSSLYNVTYEEWVNENIFKPLGMTDSTFETSNQSKILVGEDVKREPVDPKTWGWLNPTGGLFTSTSDLAKLWIGLFKSLDEEHYLSPAFANEFFAPAYVFPSEQSLVGVPFEMYLDGGYLVRMKNGAVPGYTTNMFVIPELKLAYNVMETGPPATQLHGQLFKGLYKTFHEILGGNSSKITLPENPQAFVGLYKPDHENTSAPGLTQIQVKLDTNQLFLLITYFDIVLPFPLNYARNTTFEIWDRQDHSCLRLFIRGLDMERVYFDPVSNETDYRSPGLKIFGIDPRGWTFFRRVK